MVIATKRFWKRQLEFDPKIERPYHMEEESEPYIGCMLPYIALPWNIYIYIIYICVCVVSTFSLGTWNGHWRVANLTVLFLDYILHLFGRELMLFFGATRYHSCSDYWGDCRLIQMTWMHMDDFVLPTPCVFVCLQSSWVPDISRCDYDSSKL